jgi:hypothetical protein
MKKGSGKGLIYKEDETLSERRPLAGALFAKEEERQPVRCKARPSGNRNKYTGKRTDEISFYA